MNRIIIKEVILFSNANYICANNVLLQIIYFVLF